MKKKERAKNVQDITFKQHTILESFQGKRSYNKESDRYKVITKKLAIFIGSTNVAIGLVENPELRSLIETLDPRYQVPGRALMGKRLDMLMEELKSNVQQCLSTAQHVSLCADIWSKKGLTSSYLGITAHFFGRKDHRKHRIVLAVRKFAHPHTGEHVREVVDKVLMEWEIPTAKVSAILTDNGSNMLKAFRTHIMEGDEGDKEEDGDKEDEEGDKEDEDADKEDEEGNRDDGEEDEQNDFDTQEIDHEVAFTTYIKRVSCFAHTLQLVVHKFNEVKSLARVLRNAHALIKKFNKSSRATEKLIALCGKKLISDCPTRWSSTFLMLERLLAVRGSLSTILEELGGITLPLVSGKHLEIYTTCCDHLHSIHRW